MVRRSAGTGSAYPLAQELAGSYVRVQEDITFQGRTGGPKEVGAVWTPMYIARALVHWAVRGPTDVVLDPGSGRGIFLFEAFRRLLGLGATPSRARDLLYGVEQDPLSFQELTRDLTSITGGPLPNVRHGNLFDCMFPNLDAVVGNPPYVRRWWLDNLDLLRDRLPVDAKELRLTRLTDLACYFTIYCTRFLKPGGRLGLVVSDGWLDSDYGVPFKRFLLQQFRLRRVVAFQHRVFGGVLVRPVLILAEKKTAPMSRSVTPRTIFALSSESLGKSAKTLTVESLVRRAHRALVLDSVSLDPERSWSQYLNAPSIYFTLIERDDFRPLGDHFDSRIGLQTFAKSFFIVPRTAAAELHLEEKYLHPMILSPREVDGPIVPEGQTPNYFLVWCDVSASTLRGTQLSSYIAFWEGSRVTARGGRGEFLGIQNLPRLRRASRTPWYNVKSEVERRGIYPLLVPRRIFDNYVVAWNRAGFVAAENFVELAPRKDIDLEASLALLNSSVAELAFRANAHLYGGGVYNLNPGDVKTIRLPDLGTLNSEGLRTLRQGFRGYVRECPAARAALDLAVGRTFGLSREVIRATQRGVAELKALSRSVKASPEGPLFAAG